MNQDNADITYIIVLHYVNLHYKIILHFPRFVHDPHGPCKLNEYNPQPQPHTTRENTTSTDYTAHGTYTEEITKIVIDANIWTTDHLTTDK
jgi:hypothetical protein